MDNYIIINVRILIIVNILILIIINFRIIITIIITIIIIIIIIITIIIIIIIIFLFLFVSLVIVINFPIFQINIITDIFHQLILDFLYNKDMIHFILAIGLDIMDGIDVCI